MSVNEPGSSEQELDVYFETQLVGQIHTDDGVGMRFSY